MSKLKLTGRIPSKKNSKIISCRGKRPMLFPSKKHKEWHKEASEELMKQKPPQGIEKCEVILIFTPPDKRAFDLTNKAESIMDLLVDNKIILDDNYKVVYSVILQVKEPDKEKAGCVICLNINGSIFDIYN